MIETQEEKFGNIISICLKSSQVIKAKIPKIIGNSGTGQG